MVIPVCVEFCSEVINGEIFKVAEECIRDSITSGRGMPTQREQRGFSKLMGASRSSFGGPVYSDWSGISGARGM